MVLFLLSLVKTAETHSFIYSVVQVISLFSLLLDFF